LSHDLSPDAKKELDELVKLFPEKRRPIPPQTIEQKDARALIGYITYLEEVAGFHNRTVDRTKEQSVPKNFNKADLDAALTKLVGLYAGANSAQGHEGTKT